MKNFIVLSLALAFFGCTSMKRAQTSIARTVGGNVQKTINGHEIYCSQGRVCSEINVLRIDAEDRDGGKVKVTLKNQTGDTSLIQIRLQVISSEGEVLTETKAENFTLPPTQEKIYEMPGIARKNAHIKVLLNLAY